MKPLVGGSARIVGDRGTVMRVQEGGRGARGQKDASDDVFADCLDAASPRKQPAPGTPARGAAPGGDAARSAARAAPDAQRRRGDDGAPALHGEDDRAPRTRARTADDEATVAPEGPRRDEPIDPRGDAEPPVVESGVNLGAWTLDAVVGRGSVVTTSPDGWGSSAHPTPCAKGFGGPDVLDVAALTGRHDVRVEVESLEGGLVEAGAVAVDASLAPRAGGRGVRLGEPVDDAGVSRAPPGAETEMPALSVEGFPGEANGVQGVADVPSEPVARDLVNVEGAALRASRDVETGASSTPAAGETSAGVPAEAGESGARAEGALGPADRSEAPVGRVDLPREARVLPDRPAAPAQVTDGASSSIDEARSEAVEATLERLPMRMVVGVADRDGAWKMELRRGDAGLDVLLRGDLEFVGAVRGVEADLRSALVDAGEREARVRVDVDTPGGGGAREDSRGDARGGRGDAADGSRRDTSRSERSRVAAVAESRSSRGVRLDRMI